MILRGISTLIIAYIFLVYTSLDYLSINLFLSLLLYIIVAIILKDSFKSFVTQSKQFYISR
ncbi:hypothetical protein HOF65_05405 [bacterium]|nr:hypothetical protein [bacterium]MBT3853380.1 hypothetical protein [bacterium]MBT4633021.1 hypothetical protein [bacterium]